MISREEKNKGVVKELKKEKTIAISKKLLHVFSIILISFTLLFAYMFFLGVKGLQTKEYVIKDSQIPNNFYGIKILHISDLLYGGTVGKDNLKSILQEAKKINPDIIVFTGNIINPNYTVNNDDINSINNFFKDLPYTIGKYAIKENFDTSSFNLLMEKTNFTILDNEKIDIYNNKDYISIIGLSGNIINNLTNVNENFTITLINNYDNYDSSIPSNIVLAGNNLGGEIRLFNYPLLGTNKYINSYYEENNSKIFISSGLGSIHHMRFMNHPSINVYRLYNK